MVLTFWLEKQEPGKTLIIDSLEILAGGRFSKEMIRKGENYSFVEMSVSLKNSEEDIILSREININGKNLWSQL